MEIPRRLPPLLLLFLLPLLSATTALRAADLPITETPIGRLSLPVVENSLVISPDSAHLAFATKAGSITLTDKGIFQNASGTPIVDAPPDPDLPKNLRALVRLSIDDKATASFEVLTRVVYSPDSKRLGFAAQKENRWQIVIDNRAVVQEAQSVPINPIAFSPDSAHAAWAVTLDDHLLVCLDGNPWPPILAADVGPLRFSPDSQHLAIPLKIKDNWTFYIDGKPLPSPKAPLPQSPALRPLIRLGQFFWRPDSAGIGFCAAFPNTPWQVFSQSLDGTLSFISSPHDSLLKNTPLFAPIPSVPSATDTRPSIPALRLQPSVLNPAPHLAFAASVRNKWSLFTEIEDAPSPSLPPFDNLAPDSLHYILPESAIAKTQPSTSAHSTPPDRPPSPAPQLLYLAQQNKLWHLYLNHQPLPDLTFDTILPNSFLVSPDQHHYVFAATQNHKTIIYKDAQPLLTCEATAPQTFSFSPDSQHFAAAIETAGHWFATLDATPGTAPFAGFAPEPIPFSPDSTRIAFTAEAFDKSWHLVIGPNAQYQSKPYERILKNSKVTWPNNQTLTAIAIIKTVATRLEAKLPN